MIDSFAPRTVIKYFLCLLTPLIICLFASPAISPVVPIHADVFNYISYREIPFRDCLLYARPILTLVIKLFASMEYWIMNWSLVTVACCSLLMPVWVFGKLTNRDIPLWPCLAISAIIGVHPVFYICLIHDFGARLALLLGSLGFYFMAKFLRDGERVDAFSSFLLLSLGFLSKETYVLTIFGAIAIIGILYSAPGRMILLSLLIAGAAVLMSVLHSMWVKSIFIMGKGAYAIESNVLNIFINFLKYACGTFSGPILAILIFSILLCVIRKSWRHLFLMVIGILIALGSIIPNAIMSNHYFPIYEFSAVPLVVLLSFMPIIFISFSKYNLLALIAYPIILYVGLVQASMKLQTSYGWEMHYARINANLLDSFNNYKEIMRSSREVIILGLQQGTAQVPWHPLTNKRFAVEQYGFTATHFNIIEPAHEEVSDPYCSYLKSLSSYRGLPPDLLLVVSEQGQISHIIQDKNCIIALLTSNSTAIDTSAYDAVYWKAEIEPLLLKVAHYP